MPKAVEGEYDIEAIRAEWIGKKTPRRHGRYPVEHDPIRRHCHMVEDENPLFLDPEFAARTSYGGVIAPPVLVGYFAGGGAWPPSGGPTQGKRSSGEPVESKEPNFLADVPTRGERLINMNVAWEFFAPVRVGDRLSSETVLADIFEKSIRLDPKAVWIVTQNRIYNQDDELVATNTNTLLTHRRPEVVAAEAEAEGTEQ
jgi:acyl dehydratase